MKKEFASRLLKSRFHPPQELRRALEAPAAARRRAAWPTATAKDRYVKGVVNGQFVRVKLPGREPPSRLPKLHNPASPPVKPFTQPPTTAAAGEVPTLQEFTQASRAERREFFDEYWDRVKAWIKHNFAVMVLNFGSVCSLVGFTRSDVLELRLLSVTGSLSYVVYFFALPGKRDWAPILWSLTFIAVNGQKIYQILVERKGSVVLNDEQQAIYENYFQPHGLTLKQFEYIIEKARPIRLKKGDVLVREGEQMKDIFLVTSGKTRAHHLGRRLTAVSFTPRKEKDKDLQAAASGVSVVHFCAWCASFCPYRFLVCCDWFWSLHRPLWVKWHFLNVCGKTTLHLEVKPETKKTLKRLPTVPRCHAKRLPRSVPSTQSLPWRMTQLSWLGRMPTCKPFWIVPATCVPA